MSTTNSVLEPAQAMVLNGHAAQAVVLPPAPASMPLRSEAPEVRRPRHTQPVAQAELLAATGELLSGLDAAGEPLATLLEDAGVATAFVAPCAARLDAALAARAQRQEAIAAEQQAVTALTTVFDRAQVSMMGLRQAARSRVVEPAGMTALGLNEELPRSAGLFVNEARRVLARAQQAPYAAVLTAAAYGSERLQEIVEDVAAVETAYMARCVSGQQAQNATAARDQAFAALSHEAHQLRVQVKSVLRRNPGTPQPAGL